MKVQSANKDIFQRTILILGVMASLSLFGYASVNLIRMPAVSPDAFVPKDLASSGKSLFGLLPLIFILGSSFSLLPVTIIFTIKRYSDNPAGMIMGCRLLCFALVNEVMNSLPFLGNYVYPEPLVETSSDVLLYLNQMSAIRYHSFDLAGFTVLYVSLCVYAHVYWNSKRTRVYLIFASIVTFSTSTLFLWISGGMAVALMAVSIYCLVPIPIYFGGMAIE